MREFLVAMESKNGVTKVAHASTYVAAAVTSMSLTANRDPGTGNTKEKFWKKWNDTWKAKYNGEPSSQLIAE